MYNLEQANEKNTSAAVRYTGRTKKYASILMILRALHLRPSSAVELLRRMDIFEQPV
jgi:hypothetical protein